TLVQTGIFLPASVFRPAEYSIRGGRDEWECPNQPCQGCMLNLLQGNELLRFVLLLQSATRANSQEDSSSPITGKVYLLATWPKQSSAIRLHPDLKRKQARDFPTDRHV